jgi:hypothetical protein
MDLVRKSKPGDEVKITEDLARLIKSPNEVVIASLDIIKGEYKTMPVTIEAQGIVTYDTRYLYTLSAKMSGRLDKVYLKYAFQPVRKGQKVADIYSPELVTAQRELIYLIEHDPTNSSLIESAKNKLLFLGVTQQQVDDLAHRGEAIYNFPIYSPYDGYLVGEDQTSLPGSVTRPVEGMGRSMDGSSKNPVLSSVSTVFMNTTPTELLKEGNYISSGQTLIRIVNVSALRIELDLPVSQSGTIKTDAEVTMDFGDKLIETGKVDFVQPFFTDGEEFIKIRVYVRNKDFRIGQLVRATIKVNPVEGLWIPKNSLLDLGVEQIVFIKERQTFIPRKVRTGIQSAGWIQVINGLTSSDQIASNAHYLMDSESFIKAK